MSTVGVTVSLGHGKTTTKNFLVGSTVREVVQAIREYYGFKNGGLIVDSVSCLGSDTIQVDKNYVFEDPLLFDGTFG